MAVALEQVPEDRLDDATAFSAFLDGIRSDPLYYFRFASEPQLAMAQNAVQGIETLLRGGNSSGKTTPGAALAVSLSQGRAALDGVKLPILRTPSIGWVLTQTYKQQVDSSQAAVLSYLGDHPHKIAWVSGETKGYVESVWISNARCTHVMDEKCSACSRLVFHCAESQSSIGGRIDFAWADEPPEEKTWREIRMRGRGDQPFLRWITATPLERRLWLWMRADFKDCLRKARNGRMEITTTIFDNRRLSAEALADKLAAMEGDPFKDARINGDYVDLEGSCPFDMVGLQRWQKRSREPVMERVTIQSEQSFPDGRYLVDRSIDLEIFEPYRDGEYYLGVADPSSGVKSATHDPAGLHFYRRGSRPALVARFNGYLDPYGLGNLAARIGERYGKALLDIDMTGGYGANTVTALSQKRYFNLVRDYHEDRPANMPIKYGFTITSVNRSEITTSIVRSLSEDSVEMPSSAVVANLMGITVDERDKWLAGPGRHDEDMICFGRALHLMSTMPAPPPKVRTGEDKMRRILKLPASVRPRMSRRGVRWAPV